MSRTGLEIGFEGEGAPLVREGCGKGHAEGRVRCGGGVFAAVVLKEATVEVRCDAGVAEGWMGLAAETIDVEPAELGRHAETRCGKAEWRKREICLNLGVAGGNALSPPARLASLACYGGHPSL